MLDALVWTGKEKNEESSDISDIWNENRKFTRESPPHMHFLQQTAPSQE